MKETDNLVDSFSISSDSNTFRPKDYILECKVIIASWSIVLLLEKMCVLPEGMSLWLSMFRTCWEEKREVHTVEMDALVAKILYKGSEESEWLFHLLGNDFLGKKGLLPTVF